MTSTSSSGSFLPNASIFLLAPSPPSLAYSSRSISDIPSLSYRTTSPSEKPAARTMTRASSSPMSSAEESDSI